MKSFRFYGTKVYLFSLNGMSQIYISKEGYSNDPNLNRYSADLTPDQKDALLDVVRATPHAQISPEIRRELVNSTVRGEPRPGADGDVEMN